MKALEKIFTENSLVSDIVINKVIELGYEYLRGEWKNVKKFEVKVTKILGGQSNHMFHVTTSTSATQFLLRIHRHGQNQFFTDAVNFAIFSERGLGPKLFGFFEGGRMEEFIPSKTLNADDVLKPEISYSIGSVFPKYHSIDVPVSKNPKCFQIMRESLREYSQLGGGVYTISSTNVTYSDHPIEVSYEDLNREIDLMERWSTEIFEETVVFCHNDLTCSNILQLNSSKEIMLIDWEYATYNYRGYDIAMHLSETAIVRMISPAGIKINEEFTDNPPNLRKFCEAYVDSANRMNDRNPSNRDLEIDNLMRECEFFWPTTHLFWACLLMKLGQLECNKEINLDSQARDRLAVYFHLKPRTQKIYGENMKK